MELEMDEDLEELRGSLERLTTGATELVHMVARLAERVTSLEDKVSELTAARENTQESGACAVIRRCTEPNTVYISYRVNSLGNDEYSVVTCVLSSTQSTETTSPPMRFPSQPGRPAEVVLLSDNIYSLLCRLPVQKVVLVIPQILRTYKAPALGLDASLITRIDLLWNEIRNLEQMGSLVTADEFPS